VTSREESADESGETLSWDMEQVGEVEVLPYVQVQSVAFEADGSASENLQLAVGGAAKIVSVAFTPAEASNKRFRVTNSKRSVCTVGNVTEEGFTVTPVSAGSATIKVTTASGAKVATLNVTVSGAN